MRMPRHLLQQSVDRLAAMAAPPASAAMGGGGTSVRMDTLLILAAVLCFVLCVVGLAMVARCSRMCNPSAFSVDAPMAKAPCKGMKKKALESLPTVWWQPEPSKEVDEDEAERPECAICLAEFTRGDEVRVLPHCGHGFHAACVDAWLLSSSTCPSCRRALVVPAAQSPAATESPPHQTCGESADVIAAAQASAAGPVADETGLAASTSDLSFVS